MTWQGDHMVRHVYLNVAHSPNLKPSWFGESVGYYRGRHAGRGYDRTKRQDLVDNFRTPHTEKLHVVQRFQLVGRRQDAGSQAACRRSRRLHDALGCDSALRRWMTADGRGDLRRGQFNYFNQDAEPIPQADKADF